MQCTCRSQQQQPVAAIALQLNSLITALPICLLAYSSFLYPGYMSVVHVWIPLLVCQVLAWLAYHNNLRETVSLCCMSIGGTPEVLQTLLIVPHVCFSVLSLPYRPPGLGWRHHLPVLLLLGVMVRALRCCCCCCCRSSQLSRL
jgi:hypothetical protein